MHQLCVHRDMKHLGSLESTQEARVALGTPQATLTHLSCSPNILCASYLDEHTLMYEPIVNCSSMLLRIVITCPSQINHDVKSVMRIQD